MRVDGSLVSDSAMEAPACRGWLGCCLVLLCRDLPDEGGGGSSEDACSPHLLLTISVPSIATPHRA